VHHPRRDTSTADLAPDVVLFVASVLNALPMMALMRGERTSTA
jgi:hypothetical protein